MKKINIQSNRRTMRGAVAVELALLMIPLIIMAFGVAEFGRAMYEYNTLTKSVRDAVRHVSQSTLDAAKDDAIDLAVYGKIGGAVPLLPGLEAGMVTVSPSTSDGGINLVTATISGYAFEFIFNPLILLDDGAPLTIEFGDIHATMRLQL